MNFSFPPVNSTYSFGFDCDLFLMVVVSFPLWKAHPADFWGRLLDYPV